jgi:hypothetical protein
MQDALHRALTCVWHRIMQLTANLVGTYDKPKLYEWPLEQ